MPAKRYDIPSHARFVTCSCFNRLPLLALPERRDLLVECIERSRQKKGFRVMAWVVMPEHFHLVVLPVHGELGPVLTGVKFAFARRLLKLLRSEEDPLLGQLRDRRGIARVWLRGGGYDRNVRDRDELEKFIGYIHMNPVKRGLVSQAGDWAWSSLSDYSGGKGPIEIWRG